MSDEQYLWKVAPKPWEARKSFNSPQHLWNKACEYFEWCDNNPMYKSEQARSQKGGGMIIDDHFVPPEPLIELPVKRPYTIRGLCIFLGVNEVYFNVFVSKRRRGEIKKDAEEWLHVIECIRDIVHNQQYEGAASGFFNANIVSKGLGLVDKQQIDQKTTEVREVFKIGDKEFEL